MKNNVLIGIVIFFILLLIGVSFIILQRSNLKNVTQAKINAINEARMFQNFSSIEEYYQNKGEYPPSLNYVKVQLFEPNLRNYIDPFANNEGDIRLMVYHRLRSKKNNINDYIIYSVGPDGVDNNIENVNKFNSEIIDTLYFDTYIENAGDILVRGPEKLILMMKSPAK